MSAPSHRDAGSRDDSRESLRSRIRAAGLRATPGRVATLEVLQAASTPLRHADVVERLSAGTDSAPLGLDRATVYRNLMDLTDAGLVARTDLGDHAWRFELPAAGPSLEHPHFVCTDCGEVACLADVDITIRSGRGSPRSVQRSRVEVQLRGTCDRCAE